MTRVEPHRFVEVTLLSWGVNTHPAMALHHVPDLPAGDGVPGYEELRVDGVQVPLEGLTLEVLPQFLPATDISVVAQLVPDPVVVIFLVVVQPNLGQPDGVPLENIDPRPPLVGRSLPEDVAHMGAGHDLQGAATHPGLEGELQVLSAPDIEARIVATQPLEEGSVDGEEAAGHGGAVDGLGLVAPAVLL